MSGCAILSACAVLLGGALGYQKHAPDKAHDWAAFSSAYAGHAVQEYTARADTRTEPLPPAPRLGPAGYIFQDPTFGSREVRVTDASTLPGHLNFFFLTDSSSEQNEWNANSTRFYVEGSGGHTLIFDFDPMTMSVRFTGLDMAPSPISWMAGAEFSYRDPAIIYGWTHGSRPRLEKYDLSRRGAPTELDDPARCVPVGPNDHGQDLSVSADDSRLLGVLGLGQDRSAYLFVRDQKLGCRWYNTQTGEIGGEWGPKGMATTNERFGIHNARISKGGDYVVTGSASNLVVWEVATLNVQTCSRGTPTFCQGHRASGYSHLINTAGVRDNMNVVIRPFKDLSAWKPLIPSFPAAPNWATDKHWSWNNDNPADTAPVCGTTYVGGNADPAEGIRRAWDGEVLCIRIDGRPAVWRFAHTFTTARNGFPSIPRGNVSQDGRFYMFTSDWMNTLGMSSNGKMYRTDVFVVALK